MKKIAQELVKIAKLVSSAKLVLDPESRKLQKKLIPFFEKEKWDTSDAKGSQVERDEAFNFVKSIDSPVNLKEYNESDLSWIKRRFGVSTLEEFKEVIDQKIKDDKDEAKKLFSKVNSIAKQLGSDATFFDQSKERNPYLVISVKAKFVPPRLI